jgi:hypothetical protein
VFFFYGAVCFIGAIGVFFRVPETKAREGARITSIAHAHTALASAHLPPFSAPPPCTGITGRSVFFTKRNAQGKSLAEIETLFRGRHQAEVDTQKVPTRELVAMAEAEAAEPASVTLHDECEPPLTPPRVPQEAGTRPLLSYPEEM